jgi:outer membrane receptor protein involved in Fe transport
VDLSVFATWATDLITFVPQGAEGREIATNIGRARILGLELGAHGEVGPFFARVAYTLLSSENLSACAAPVGSMITTTRGPCDRPPLPGRPADDLVSDAGVHVGPARVRYGVDVVSGEYVDTVANVSIPARVLQSTGASLDVPRVPGLRVAIDVRNLFDVRTGLYVGGFAQGAQAPLTPEPIGDAYLYPLPGRSLMGTIRYETTR